jgi:hypothetical protein
MNHTRLSASEMPMHNSNKERDTVIQQSKIDAIYARLERMAFHSKDLLSNQRKIGDALLGFAPEAAGTEKQSSLPDGAFNIIIRALEEVESTLIAVYHEQQRFSEVVKLNG